MPQKSRSLTSAKNPAVQRFRDAAAGRAEGLMLAEGVRLVRGESTSQPEKPIEHVLVSSGVGVPTGALILGAD